MKTYGEPVTVKLRSDIVVHLSKLETPSDRSRLNVLRRALGLPEVHSIKRPSRRTGKPNWKPIFRTFKAHL